MKRNFTYFLAIMVVAGGFSACGRVETVTKEKSETITTVFKDGSKEVKTYKLTPSDGKPIAKKETPKRPKAKKEKIEKPKRLLDCQAKKILKDQLRKNNEERLTASFRIGYFECNDYNERLNLLKLAANNIVDLRVDEIIAEDGPTYWVTAELTWKGKWLCESPLQPEFPEDRITEEEARAQLLPSLDQDQWGIPTKDTIVPVSIKTAMSTFYSSLQAGQTYDKSLMDANMACAMRLLDTLAAYGVNKLEANPFVRDLELTPENVQAMKVMRMPRLVNAYLVSIAEKDFLYVLDTTQNVVIEDLAYIAPEDLKSLDQTVCSLAGTLTKEEIIAARIAKRQRDELEAKMREAAENAPVPEEAQEEDFVMCQTEGGLKAVQHNEPTLYELAKKAEHFENVVLLAAVKKVSVDEKRLSGDKKAAFATINATYELRRVNAVGRIFLGLRNGTKEEKEEHLFYTKKDGWQIGGPGAAEPKPEQPASVEQEQQQLPPTFGQGQEQLPSLESEDESSLGGMMGDMFGGMMQELSGVFSAEE